MRMARRPLSFICLLTLATLLLTGCWDARDINDRTPALSVGFDRTEGGRWRVILAEVLPQGGESARYVTNIHTGEGATIPDAFDQVRSHSSRRLYIGSVGTYVLGKNVVADGVKTVLHFLTERRESSQTSFLLATDGTAEALLQAPDGALGSMPVRLDREFEVQEALRNGHLPIQVWEAYRRALTPGSALFLPVFNVFPGEGAEATGTAIIGPDGRRVLQLDHKESVTLRWLLGIPGRSLVALPDGTTIKTTWNSVRVRVLTRNPLTLGVSLAAKVEAYSQPDLLVSSARIKEVEALAARTLLEKSLALLKKLQASAADVPEWHETAEQAGIPGFDFRTARLVVTTRVTMEPKDASTL